MAEETIILRWGNMDKDRFCGYIEDIYHKKDAVALALLLTSMGIYLDDDLNGIPLVEHIEEDPRYLQEVVERMRAIPFPVDEAASMEELYDHVYAEHDNPELDRTFYLPLAQTLLEHTDADLISENLIQYVSYNTLEDEDGVAWPEESMKALAGFYNDTVSEWREHGYLA